MNLHSITDSADNLVGMAARLSVELVEFGGHEPWLLLAVGAAFIAVLSFKSIGRR